jgi:transposase InsO family protein
VRIAFVARERTHYPTRLLCRVLKVSTSGFYDYLQRQGGPDPESALRADLRRIHAHSRGTYGRPRLVRALRAGAHTVGHKRVARLMREEGLRGKTKGRHPFRIRNSSLARPVPGNLLDRRFDVHDAAPAWVGDITCLPTREGWLYLAVVIDLRTRQVLGYSLSERMSEALARQALLNAWTACPMAAGTLFHSDQGSQYTSDAFRQTLTAHGFIPSMSRRGNCWDNAVAESFFATLKNEEATGVYETKVDAQVGIADYIHGFYNPTRLHSALHYRSPNDYAKRLKHAA